MPKTVHIPQYHTMCRAFLSEGAAYKAEAEMLEHTLVLVKEMLILENADRENIIQFITRNLERLNRSPSIYSGASCEDDGEAAASEGEPE